MKKLLLKIYKALNSVLHPIFGGKGIGNTRIVGPLIKRINNSLKSDYVIINGFKMYLDPNDSLALSLNQVYEEAETKLVTREVRKGDIVLDIGANIGYFTLIFANLVGNEGKVYAFEPDPVNFSILKKNVEANGFTNVVLVQKAVSDKTGKLKLYISDDNRGDHRIHDSENGRNSVEIFGITIDSFFENLDPQVNFVKMDIQGAEWGALNGMKGIINKNKNLKILSEFWPAGLVNSNASPRKYLEFFYEGEFKVLELDNESSKLKNVTLSKLLETNTVEKDNYTNIFCIKE